MLRWGLDPTIVVDLFNPGNRNPVPVNGIRTITLDLDDTLWEIHPVIRRAEKRLYEWLGERYPRITEMFDIKYPIICGAMMYICKSKLCAAISNAGGMGNLTAAT